MSSKYKRPVPPRDPATLKVTRGDIINFMNFMSMDENFCLRVWNTVQNAHAKYKAAEEDAALRANAAERAAEKASQEAPIGESPVAGALVGDTCTVEGEILRAVPA